MFGGQFSGQIQHQASLTRPTATSPGRRLLALPLSGWLQKHNGTGAGGVGGDIKHSRVSSTAALVDVWTQRACRQAG